MATYLKKIRIYQVANVIGFIITIVVNALANTIPINGKTTGEIANSYPNLFVPAPITFAIWGVIYIALAVFVVYQLGFLSKQNNNYLKVVSEIGWSFVIASLANTMWIFAWHYEKILISVLIMLILLISLIDIYQAVSEQRISLIIEKLAVQVPFSIYLGWITVATIANITTFLVSINWDGFGIPPQIWTIIVILLATGITFKYLFYKKDIVYALTIVWALMGIIIQHVTTFNGQYRGIIITTALCIVLIVAGIWIVRRMEE